MGAFKGVDVTLKVGEYKKDSFDPQFVIAIPAGIVRVYLFLSTFLF